MSLKDLVGVDSREAGKWVATGTEGLPLPPRTRALTKQVSDGHLTVFVGKEPDGWHLSISHRTNHHPPRPGRNPRWNEIKEARYLFCPLTITMAMLLPPPEEFVNLHATTFHLWEIQ